MALDFAGIFTPQSLATYTFQQIRWIRQQYFVNQYPLISRLRRGTATGSTIETRRRKYRPRNYVLGGSLIATGATTVVTIADVTSRGDTAANPGGFGDTSTLMAGDILNVDSERIEVIATANSSVAAEPLLSAFGTGLAIPAAGTILVRRAAEGTTEAVHTSAAVMTLIGNSRTGGEVNQNGYYATPIKATQYVQTWQFPVQIGGGVEAERPYGMQDGSPFEVDAKQKLEDMSRDQEKSLLYGAGEVYGTTNPRQKQIGLSNLCVTNRITAPTGASAYTPADFEADVMARLWEFGSVPDIIVCSSDFMRGLTTWSYSMERIPDAGRTVFGVDIQTYQSNLAPGCQIIVDPTMNIGELFVGMQQYMWWAEQQAEYFKPRGSRGDAMEGEWIGRGCVMLDDEQKAAYLSGITGYGAPF